MAKPQRKENGIDHNDSQLLCEQPYHRSSQDSPGISVHGYETFELHSTFAGLNASDISLSLQQAIRENNVAFVQQCFRKEHVDIDTVDSNNQTALHHAASSNQNEVVTMLLDNKADINWIDYKGLTPLHEAVR